VRFQAESDDMHVSPQNTISTFLLIKTGHSHHAPIGGKSRKRAGDASRARAQRWGTILQNPSSFGMIFLFYLLFFHNF
jgi:hypothetical protein